MKALSFSPRAEVDIDGIWDYSADNWGPDQADRYTDEIRDACHALASLSPGALACQSIIESVNFIYARPR